eukprot:jgi/Mesen1/1718/ME000138S00584
MAASAHLHSQALLAELARLSSSGIKPSSHHGVSHLCTRNHGRTYEVLNPGRVGSKSYVQRGAGRGFRQRPHAGYPRKIRPLLCKASSVTSEKAGGKKKTLKLTSRGIVWSDDEVETVLEIARERIGEWHLDMMRWRRQIHMQPELAFQEHATSDMVARLLAEWGYEVDRSLGGTGVVGTLTAGAPTDRPAIMLRADMDALPMAEDNEFEHRSRKASSMHACGHDGAEYYARAGGRVQRVGHPLLDAVTPRPSKNRPAEEGTPTDNKWQREGGGAAAMLEDGLLDKYPVRAAFGMHNWPGLAVGRMAVHSGAVMAGVDCWDITVAGVGCHAAMPHLGQGADAVVCAAQIVTALQAGAILLPPPSSPLSPDPPPWTHPMPPRSQPPLPPTLVSRRVDPQDSAVVSVTQMHAGDAYNVIPPKVELKGTIRSYREETRAAVHAGLRQVATSVAAAYGCTADVKFRDYYPATINSRPEAEECAAAARGVSGHARVDFDTVPPSMGAEDFGYILQQVPGCYVWIGNGPTEGGCMLHNPRYDFNDDVLALGASYWVQLVENALPRGPLGQ